MYIEKIKNTVLYDFLNEFKNRDAPITDKKYPYFAILVNALIIAPTVIVLAVSFIVFSPILFILSLIKELILDPLIKRKEEKRKKEKEKFIKRVKLKILNNLDFSFMKYQTEIHKNRQLLYLDGYEHDNNLKLYEFILFFLNNLNYHHTTRIKYLNISRTNHQCNAGRRRSLHDIYLICKNYYPTCTLYEVFRILIELFKQRQIAIQYCSTIGNYTFYPRKVSEYVSLDRPVHYFTKQFYHLNLEDLKKIKITMSEIINHLNHFSYEKTPLS